MVGLTLSQVVTVQMRQIAAHLVQEIDVLFLCAPCRPRKTRKAIMAAITPCPAPLTEAGTARSPLARSGQILRYSFAQIPQGAGTHVH